MKNFDKVGLKDLDMTSIITLFLIEKYFKKNFQISWFPNASILLKNFAELEEIFILLSYYGLRNKNVYSSDFSNHAINSIGKLVEINGKYKPWDTVKYEYNLNDKKNFNASN